MAHCDSDPRCNSCFSRIIEARIRKNMALGFKTSESDLLQDKILAKLSNKSGDMAPNLILEDDLAHLFLESVMFNEKFEMDLGKAPFRNISITEFARYCSLKKIYGKIWRPNLVESEGISSIVHMSDHSSKAIRKVAEAWLKSSGNSETLSKTEVKALLAEA